MIDMAKKEILPAAAKYIKDIAKTAELARAAVLKLYLRKRPLRKFQLS